MTQEATEDRHIDVGQDGMDEAAGSAHDVQLETERWVAQPVDVVFPFAFRRTASAEIFAVPAHAKGATS